MAIVYTNYIIFDMDGVLIDSMPSWYKCAYKVMNSLQNDVANVTSATKKAIWRNFGKMDEDTKEYFLKVWYEEMSKAYENVELKEGVRKFLDICKENNIHMAVATSTPKDMALKVLTRLDLIKYFDKIEDEEESKEPKYSGKIFDDIKEFWNVNEDNITIFEDSFNNCKIPKTKGYNIIGVYDSVSDENKTYFPFLTPYFIYSFNDLFED